MGSLVGAVYNEVTSLMHQHSSQVANQVQRGAENLMANLFAMGNLVDHSPKRTSGNTYEDLNSLSVECYEECKAILEKAKGQLGEKKAEFEKSNATYGLWEKVQQKMSAYKSTAYVLSALFAGYAVASTATIFLPGTALAVAAAITSFAVSQLFKLGEYLAEKQKNSHSGAAGEVLHYADISNALDPIEQILENEEMFIANANLTILRDFPNNQWAQDNDAIVRHCTTAFKESLKSRLTEYKFPIPNLD